MSQKLNLNGCTFQELFSVEGLSRLDSQFLSALAGQRPDLREKMQAYRAGQHFTPIEVSHFIIEAAPYLERFIAKLFDIEEALLQQCEKTLESDPIFAFKKHYILREARRAQGDIFYAEDFLQLNAQLNRRLIENHFDREDQELAIAQYGQYLLNSEKSEEIAELIEWCVSAMKTPEGQKCVQGWALFKLPQKLHYENLVPVVSLPDDPWARLEGPLDKRRHREGFALTDPRMSAREVQSEIHYCVYCDKTDGDFCSKGFPVKKGDPAQGLKINPVGDILTGCPLDEKISEMHRLKRDGYSIAALATVMVDNPMCPVTGHRICNDCMKACIYQKQDPVNIPQTETGILTDVLALPWGVEIYDLLTRWNPLRSTQFLPKPYNGLKVLVMGMGPAGFTLAHHLLLEGFAVVGADGLKLEPLSSELIQKPIYRYQDLVEKLDERIMVGFGGVAEYGITVRWDKNFLKLIYISLMRRSHFQLIGSVRFGGTLTVQDVWELGFDHLALAVGAGLPRELSIPNSLAVGMRQANDFLMALQLTGAAKKNSLANLQVRLPAVIIGGGLTGIDTATEVQAYYIAQVEKVQGRYEKLREKMGEKFLREKFAPEDIIILDEFLQHAECVKIEREQAIKENRSPDFCALIRAWGGVTVVYRRSMQESPAYERNHEELMNAFQEGILYAEGLEPAAVILDEFSQAKALKCQVRVMDELGKWMATDETQIIPARSIFVATGAKPNVAYEFEHKGTFARQGFEYRRFEFENNQLKLITEKNHVKDNYFGPFTSYDLKHHKVSFLGDTHPVFHGSVVKAIASAKRSYPKITEVLAPHFTAGDEDEYAAFRSKITEAFRSAVVSVRELNSKTLELKVRSPWAAKNNRPGQFYRVQNYECFSREIEGTRLQMEALAVIAFQLPQDSADILTFMIEERGTSSRLVRELKANEPLALMGPTGARFRLAESKGAVMIIGGNMAVAHLLSLRSILEDRQVIFVGLFAEESEMVYREEVAKIAQKIIIVNASSDIFEILRDNAEDLSSVIVLGDAALLKSVQKARGPLQTEDSSGKIALKKDCQFVASVFGPMQCMLKGVCAQCLQWQIDPVTGKRTKAVYACSWQNQPLEIVDIDNLSERLAQNHLQETLNNLWLSTLLGEEIV